ncbi:MAG: hypothetical protein IKV73_01960 [Clostridia bacterium]|nr:hypothetical protein [Clostridia bacterium]
MKSRKFKAVLAAVSAIAVLATAMTGFAATINTVTTYNVGSTNKATVRTIVSGLENKTAEVTLLVKTVPGAGVGGSAIAYIDQKPASAGEAIFEYQLDKTALSDATQATVISGNTDGEAVTNTAGNDDLNVKNLADDVQTGYTISYENEAYGNGDGNVTAMVTVTDATKKIKSITVGENDYTATPGAVVVPVKADGSLETINVELEANEVEASVTDKVITAKPVNGKYEVVAIVKYEGTTVNEVGVTYEGQEFRSVHDDTNDGIVAIKLIANEDISSNVGTYIK